MKRIIIFSMAAAFVISAARFAPAVESRSTDLAEQTSVEVTVYNSNIGLVKDQRKIPFIKGVQELRFMGVASQIIPTSVGIKSSSHPDGLSVIEQNYEYDLLNPAKLLDKYVGKEVKLVTRNSYTDKEEIVPATIVSSNNGTIVYKIGNEITFNHPGRIIFPRIPENLIPRPTLVWLVESQAAASLDVEALYLTGGINWYADYVMILDEKDTRADLSGWVTIDNKSGAMYKDARLKLVAGDVNRVEQVRPAQMYPSPVKKAAGAPQFQEESFFEYHIYKLDRRTTIKENQTKQVSFLETQGIPVTKEFIYKGAPYYYQSRYEDLIAKEKVAVYVEMMNKKEHNLGMPLPKGTIRVYKLDRDGSRQFIGEDRIEHTPKDEKIRARLGYAFDIAAKRKQTQWEKISKDTYEVAFEITLRNHKKEDVVVKVVEPLPGDWKVLESSLEYTKEDSRTIFFQAPVKKDGETKLTYRVRVKF
ncbi:MAG TPA: hypothetical protein VGJ94_01375 [Syntrophorhabdaceae bacterium]|jgi:hypothetical protein